MAYIKKEPIVEFITKGLNNPDKTKAYGYDAIEILTEIEYTPTADVVEVVRCSECKHCWHHVPDYTYPDRTDEVWECVKKIDWVEPDHFCSYGERKERF